MSPATPEDRCVAERASSDATMSPNDRYARYAKRVAADRRSLNADRDESGVVQVRMERQMARLYAAGSDGLARRGRQARARHIVQQFAMANVIRATGRCR